MKTDTIKIADCHPTMGIPGNSDGYSNTIIIFEAFVGQHRFTKNEVKVEVFSSFTLGSDW